MQITLTGHHLEITDGITNVVNQRVQKLKSHHPDLSSVDVIVKLESNEQCVEINSHGISASASASHRDLYVAIANAVRKLDAILSNKRGSQQAQRHHKTELAETETVLEDDDTAF